MNLSELQLLALVRASLWQKPVDESPFPQGKIDWQKLGQLALHQTVGGLAFEAALSLPQALLPPKEWRLKALSFIETNRRTHLLVDGCVAEVVSKLKGNGINSVLLKGQAYARAYPRLEMRQCGDIDLYVGEGNYRRAYEAVKACGWKREEEFLPNAKHYGCWYRGVRIEFHRQAVQISKKTSDQKIQQWCQNQFSASSNTLNIANEGIPVPSAAFDVVFVFLHLYHHFLNGGIGLRHVCDWTMLLHKHAKDINTEELGKLLNEFNLMKGWRKFAPIAVEYLGLPESECPFYSPEYRLQADRILAFIFMEGNFGRAQRRVYVRPKGYLAGKAYSFRKNTKRMMLKLSIDPNTISKYYVSYLFTGITRVFNDIMKRD